MYIQCLSALTLLVGCQEGHPASKDRLMRCWCGYLSGARCRLFAYGPPDATSFRKTPLSLDSFKSGLVLLFLYRLTQVVLEKGLLNGCSSSSNSASAVMLNRTSSKTLAVNNEVTHRMSQIGQEQEI